ncbi:MAG: hypothetical protein ACKOUM_07565 [Sphingopyxis sp.]
MKRVVFLFNHDAAHQVAHLAGVAAAMARDHAGICTIIACAPAIRGAVQSAMGADAAALAQWQDLQLPPWLDRVARVGNALFPAARLARLAHFAPMLQSADMVVSTERTCLRVQARMRKLAKAPRMRKMAKTARMRKMDGGRVPPFAIIPHGAGDRNVSYHPDFARFDLVMVAGKKVVDAMVAAGVPAQRLHIIGYPKFDMVDFSPRPSPFANGRPTFVYNPHFDPHLSRWYRHGPDILRWFASDAGQQFNLIFAPHVMLFRKRWHISPEYRVVARRPDIPAVAHGAANIHIDVDSPALFDMTHMLSADAYIGDMSSQIYEFLARPRAAFFIDTHDGFSSLTDPARTGAAAEHQHMRAGPVAVDAASLIAHLPGWANVAQDYRAAQEQLFNWTFDTSATPASRRAAACIATALGA